MYDGNDLECSGIESGLPLNQTIELLDNYICEAIGEINASINLVNVGEGEDIYAGIDGIGRRKIKRVNTDSNILTITPNTDDITFSIDEDALNTFIEENQKTYSVANVGTDPLRVKVYKDSTIVGDNTQFNFRTVVTENLGAGKSFLKDIQENTDELNVRVKTLVSDNLTITATDEEVRIETPMTASISALYVNNLYIPTYNEWVNAGGDLVTNPSFLYKGEGALAKPFTDSINYTSTVAYTITANSSIQNALDAYVGSGTRLAPERIDERVEIQNNNGFYTFSGNFGYSGIYVSIDSTVVSTTTGYILDMDNTLHFNNLDLATVFLKENGILQIQGTGFNNSGSNVASSYLVDSKTLILLGEGWIEDLQNTNVLTTYVVNSDISETGNNNDGGITFDIRCFITSNYRGIYNVKGDSRIDVRGQLQSGFIGGTVNSALKAFNQEGGQIRIFKEALIQAPSSRDNFFTFDINSSFAPAIFSINSATLEGNATTLFNKLSNEDVTFTVVNLSSGANLTITEVFDSTDLWLATFKSNTVASGNIDPTKVDLTMGNNISSVNYIGNNVIESLTIHNNRAAALLAGRPLYSAYLKTSGVAYPTTAGWVRDIVLPA